MEIKSNYLELNKINYEINSVSDELIEIAKKKLIDLLKLSLGDINPEQVKLNNSEFTIWPDTALGCPQEGQFYAQIVTPGYQLQFEYEGKNYSMHINLDGSKVVSPMLVQPLTQVSCEKIKAPSIFELSAAPSQKKSSVNLDVFQVDWISVSVNKPTNYYFYRVTLSNKHTFEVPVSLKEIENNKIYYGMSFRLVDEVSLSSEPGRSTFMYTSLENENIQLEGKFDSIKSEWHPDPSLPLIEVTQKFSSKSGMSNVSYNVRFSEGPGMSVDYSIYNKFFNVGDKLFKVNDSYLVNVKDGRVITRNYVQADKFVKVTW